MELVDKQLFKHAKYMTAFIRQLLKVKNDKPFNMKTLVLVKNDAHNRDKRRSLTTGNCLSLPL